MMYRSSDNGSFSDYTALCDHHIYFSKTLEELLYWKDEKVKIKKRQRGPLTKIFLFFMLPITLPICTLLGVLLNVIDAVFGEE